MVHSNQLNMFCFPAGTWYWDEGPKNTRESYREEVTGDARLPAEPMEGKGGLGQDTGSCSY